MAGWNEWVPGTNMTLSEVLDALKSASIGLDVKDKLYWSFFKIVQEAIKDGNANFDVEMAKGVFATLKARLDAGDEHVDDIIADVNAQLGELGATATFKGSDTNANIIAKTGMQIGDEWFDTTNQQALRWNGTAWVAVGGAIKLGHESVNEINLASNSVSLSKTTFIKPSYPNYANNATVEKNKLYSFETGVPSNNSQFDSYIMVLSVGQSYITRYSYNDSSPTTGSWVSFFDSSGVFIGGVNASEFTVPEGTHRTIVARRNFLDTELLVTDKSTSYTYNLSDDISPNLNVSRGELNRKKTDWYQSTKELHLEYNPITRLDGYYYGQGGSIVTSSTWGTTPKLYLEKNTTYVKKWFSNQGENAGSFITYWRDDGTDQGVYISTSNETPEFTTPNYFDFVRMAVHGENNERALLYKKSDPFKVRDNRIIIEPENLSKRNNPLFGKVINILSDSFGSTDYRTPNWWQQISIETGAIFNDYAWSGTTLAHDPSASRHLKGQHHTTLPEGTEIGGCMVERYVDMDPTADITLIMGTTNDNNTPLGAWDSVNDSDLFGALNIMMAGLKNMYPGQLIIWMTPNQTANEWTSAVIDPLDSLKNTPPTSAVSRQLRAEAIKAKARQYGYPVIDNWSGSGINGSDINQLDFISDKLHHSDVGQIKLKRKILNGILANV